MKYIQAYRMLKQAEQRPLPYGGPSDITATKVNEALQPLSFKPEMPYVQSLNPHNEGGSDPDKKSYQTIYKDKSKVSPYLRLEPAYEETTRYVPAGHGGVMPVKVRGKQIGWKPAENAISLEGESPKRQYTTEYAKPGQTAVITLGGALDPSHSYIEGDSGIPVYNRYAFRYSDREQAEALARELADKGVNVKLIGHSRGGGAADQIGYNMQQDGYNPEVVLIDPVSPNLIFGRDTTRKSKNATVVLPSDRGLGGFWKCRNPWGAWSNLIAKMGGRYTPKGDEYTYTGYHGEGYEPWIRSAATRRPDGTQLWGTTQPQVTTVPPNTKYENRRYGK